MDRARSFGQHMLLAATLAVAWIPAAMLASPAARATSPVAEAPTAEVVPASDKAQEIPVDTALRKT